MDLYKLVRFLSTEVDQYTESYKKRYTNCLKRRSYVEPTPVGSLITIGPCVGDIARFS